MKSGAAYEFPSAPPGALMAQFRAGWESMGLDTEATVVPGPVTLRSPVDGFLLLRPNALRDMDIPDDLRARGQRPTFITVQVRIVPVKGVEAVR